MFLGRFVHTIDAKGRVSIPAGLRVEFQRRSDRTPILTHADSHLALYPYEEWLDRAERLKSLAFPQPDVQAFQRFFASGAVECPLDAQGRILIPPYLRQHAELEREVTIAGVVDRVEIWDRDRFEADLARTRARFNEISEEVAKLGL